MSDKPFHIYRSSAGSGKTYTLAKEYLKLALWNVKEQKPGDFRSILAVTFTNKATQEMKDRIIAYLHELALGKSSPLSRELLQLTGLSEELLQKRASEVLSSVLHAYSYFTVSTIDSFFQRVIRAFAKEAGLQAGFKIELDQDKVLDAVIDSVLESVGEDVSLTTWLRQFAQDKVDEGKSWDFRGDIKTMAQELFSESFKGIEREVLEVSARKDFAPDILKKLREVVGKFENVMKEHGKLTIEILEKYGLTLKDFSYGASGVMGYLEKLAHTKAFEPGKRARQAIHDVEKWYSKTSKKKELIEQAFNDGLNDILVSAINAYDQQALRYETALQVLKYFYNYGILSHLTQKLQEYRDEHDVMLISDAASFLKGIISGNDAPFIYEKVGSVYQNFLIDEFQDTSGFQWDNFKPLLENSVAQGNENLVVGDIKQSIYRWRGGDWRLLLEKVEQDMGKTRTGIVTLNHNWRSKPNVIDFNNSLFNSASQVLSQSLKNEIAAEVAEEKLQDQLNEKADQISQAYTDVYQQYPDAKKEQGGFQGYVNMNFLPKTLEVDGQEISWQQQMLEKLPGMVEDLQDKGYQLRDVAFLVRTKTEGKLLADAMMAYKASEKADTKKYSYEVVSSESLYMNSAFTVRLLIQAMHYLNNATDCIARANVAFEYQRYILNNHALDLHPLFAMAATVGENESAFARLLPEEFVSRKVSLIKRPLYELVEELIRIFTLNHVKGEFVYLQAFQDAVLEFSKNEKADVTTFLEWWENTGQRRSVKVSEELNAIRILTIHKSKGLQYKVVMVPFCNWSLDNNTQFANFLWASSELPPFNEIRYLPLNYSQALKKTVYSRHFFEEMIRARLDNLNLLYVAFTRAEEHLYAFAPQPENARGEYKLNDIGSVMYHIFRDAHTQEGFEVKNFGDRTYRDLSEYWKTEQRYLEIGVPEVLKNVAPVETEENEALTEYISTQWRKRLTIRRRSRDFFNLEEKERESNINYGVLIHDLLSRIITPDQLPYALKEMEFEGMIGSEEVDKLQKEMEVFLAHDKVKRWFSEDWTVKTEVPVIAGDAFNTKDKRMDRVMIRANKAIVVDFKASKNESMHKQYLRQVKEYVEILRNMGYEEVEGYLLYVHPVEEEKVV